MNTDAQQRHEAERQRRIETIRDGAVVRQYLGQAAQYRRLSDGRHEVTHRGWVFTGTTLEEAIEKAKEARQ